MQQQFRLPKLNDRDGDLSKRWYVYYSFRHPETGKLTRKKEYISSRIATKRKRRERGYQLIDSLTKKLQKGWNPFAQDLPRVTNIVEAIDMAITTQNANCRPNSVMKRKSIYRQFVKWLKDTKRDKWAVDLFSKRDAMEYSDHISVERGLSPRTHNNHVQEISTLFNNLVQREYIMINPWKVVSRKKEPEAKHTALTMEEIQAIRKYCEENGEQDFWFCFQLGFYTLARPKEMTMLRKSDFILTKMPYLVFRPEVSKNSKQETVPIPTVFLNDLSNRLSRMREDDYIISTGLRIGTSRIWPTRLAERFKKIRDEIGISSEKRFYDYKPSSVRYMLEENRATLDEIRRQCRHSSIAETQAYINRIGNIVRPGFVEGFVEI